MSAPDPKHVRKSPDESFPTTPPVDERANAVFYDTLFDTDGRPNSAAEAIVEIEGFDDDGDER